MYILENWARKTTKHRWQEELRKRGVDCSMPSSKTGPRKEQNWRTTLVKTQRQTWTAGFLPQFHVDHDLGPRSRALNIANLFTWCKTAFSFKTMTANEIQTQSTDWRFPQVHKAWKTMLPMMVDHSWGSHGAHSQWGSKTYRYLVQPTGDFLRFKWREKQCWPMGLVLVVRFSPTFPSW